jgi:hypothetical protein
MGRKPQKGIIPAPNIKPKEKKIPKPLDTTAGHKIQAWCFKHMDWGGPFSWQQCAEWQDVFTKLKDFQDKSLAGKEAKGSHKIETPNLSSDAKKRLESLQLDDIDAVFSFRLTGKCRVFGINGTKHGWLIHLLWFDPGHLVCPSELKNT